MITELPTIKQRIVTENFNAFKILYINIDLNTRAEITVNLIMNIEENINGEISKTPHHVTNFVLILEGEDYNNWGNDDNYINNYVYNHLINMSTVV